jgi:predicted O-methyltransferase YrrM
MTVMTDIEIADPRVEQYAVEHTTPEPAWFAALAEETRTATRAPTMMVGTLEGRLLTALVAMLRPRSVLEIGTFTGYSALSMAEALPADGRIVTCDINEEHLAIARRHIAASPYAGMIEIRSGPALATIATLPGPFDLVFIDADKTSYSAYFEATLAKLAPDGVILVDNVLWSGRVLDPAIVDPDTAAIKEFNDQVLADDRVEVVMLTVRDGVSLIRHRRAGRAG